jgi:hypothetical protein
MKYEVLEEKIKKMVQIIPDTVNGKIYYAITLCADGLAFTFSVTSDEKMAQKNSKTLENCLINEMRHYIDTEETMQQMLDEFCGYLAKEGIYDLGRSRTVDGKKEFVTGHKACSAIEKFIKEKGGYS